MRFAFLALVAATLLTPPSGRPPMGPLVREDPRVYDLKFEVMVNTSIAFRQDDPRLPRNPKDKRGVSFGGIIDVVDTPIVMPLIFQGTFSRVDPDSVRAELYLENRPDTGLPGRFRIEEGYPHHGHLAVLPIAQFRGRQFRWNVSYRVQSFSSRINDAAAAQIPWPREWPEEVADGLQPQLYIESNDDVFKQTVERITSGRLRLVPPYLVAKELVRYCLRELNSSGTGQARGHLGVLQGMRVVGARQAAADGRGGPHDILCVCVAMLRAAGIPARPVIGVFRNEENNEREEFVSWGEFYLPGAGWVPFDPAVMRGKGIMHRDVRQPWPEFGTMDDLNERIPLAYHFMPPRAVESPLFPALWGWDPRPNRAPNAEQVITIQIFSRGPGVQDPR